MEPKTKPQFPDFFVDGIPQDQLFRLYGASNLRYYMKQVHDIRQGICPFCIIDTDLNQEIKGITSIHWRVWNNPIAPRSGQDYQFVIPLRRHVERIAALTSGEMADLRGIISALDEKFRITGGALLIRSGDPIRHSGSVPHLHANYHVPSGLDKVEITLAKAPEKLRQKLAILKIWERMRVAMEDQGVKSPADMISLNIISPDEYDLVKDKLGPPETAIKT